MTQTPTHTPESEMLNWGRLLMDGIPFADMIGARERSETTSWLDYWLKRADAYERLGAQAEQEGHLLSAGEYFFLGSLCAQYSQFLWFDGNRAHAQERKVALYQKAAPLLAPPAQRVELEVAGLVMPVYVRLPKGPGPHPVAIQLGGLESTKEESRNMEDLLLQRGVGTATFDGPGQGEMFNERALAGDYERYTSAVVDHLSSRPDVDASRIGVLGRSLGGNYALKSAAMDQRLAACISWGGFSDLDYWEAETPLTKESWRYVSKVDTLEEAREYVHRALETRDVLSRIACPTYVLHGRGDEVPMSFIDTVKARVDPALLTVVVEDEGDHCCHNLGPRPRLQMADWMADQLHAGSAEGAGR